MHSVASAQTPATLTVAQILQHYHEATAPNGAKPPKTLEVTGTISGAASAGIFHSWHDQTHDRNDQSLGARRQRTYTIDGHYYYQNSSSDLIEYKGVLLQRAITEDFVTSSRLYEQPQYSTLRGRVRLPDGRDVYQIAVQPPGGEAQTLSIDAQTYLLDRVAYVDEDGVFTIDLSDYRNVGGNLYSFKSVQSDGNHPFDLTQMTTRVIPNAKIAQDTFTLPEPARVRLDGAVTVPLTERNGALYTEVRIHGHPYTFLIDSGAQAIVFDSGVAAKEGLASNGSIEAKGATRSGGVGVAQIESVHVGGAIIPVGAISVLDLSSSTDGRFPIDGILGFPFFACAEVQMDYAHLTMTIMHPGALSPGGARLDVDIDRELPEVTANAEGISGRFLLDTGNSNELLLFHHFVSEHPGLLPYAGASIQSSYGIGGSTRAYNTQINELDLANFRLYHRYTSVILSDEGAFADRIDAGNIGLGVLKNFILTFDLPSRAVYLQVGANFDDGRGRATYDGTQRGFF